MNGRNKFSVVLVEIGSGLDYSMSHTEEWTGLRDIWDKLSRTC